MKKILLSLLTIGIVGTMGYAATRAFFSDTETKPGNTITAGTIDISVDNENPWNNSTPYTLEDMKPSQVRWIEFTIKNIGGNPAVVWKHIDVTATSSGTITEPECTDQGGLWNGTCDWQGHEDNNNIHEVITYDLEVNGEVIIDGDWHVKMADVDSLWIPLGRIEPNGEMAVKQSYHIQDEAGNEYQGDQLTFNIDLYAEQLLGTGPGPTFHGVILENKTGDPDWTPIMDGTWGLLTYGASGSTFDYDFKGYGLTPGINYSLIYYPEPQTTWPWPVTVINSGSADAVTGNLDLSGTPDLGMDLDDAKIWLVLTSDIPGNSFTSWSPGSYLFESNLIDYDDTDI